MLRDINSRASKTILFVMLVLSSLFIARMVTKGNELIIFGAFFLVVVVLLYRHHFEIFILLVLMINQEFFFLAPRSVLGTANYQDLLFAILPLSLLAVFFRRRRVPLKFTKLLLAFYVLIAIAVLNSTFQGQPLVLGLKAAKGYYLLLFYFVFVSQRINLQRLTQLIVLTGVLLTFLNNLQYLSWGSLSIFEYGREFVLERGGQMRFLMGDFFTIFAPIVALGAYLHKKHKTYLFAFIYMVATVFIQGQTRAVMFGLTITTTALFYFAQKIRLKALVGISVIFVSLILAAPLFEKTIAKNIYEETVNELISGGGNVGIRYKAYDYYWNELSTQLMIGRGIWNDAYTDSNPQNMKHQGLYISDIGIMGFLFHTGLIGFFWLVAMLFLAYNEHFKSFGNMRPKINYGVLGYFIFSVLTLVTLDGLTSRSNIVYLALSLTIIDQYRLSFSPVLMKPQIVMERP
jgi:hypothetical protein